MQLLLSSGLTTLHARNLAEGPFALPEVILIPVHRHFGTTVILRLHHFTSNLFKSYSSLRSLTVHAVVRLSPLTLHILDPPERMS